MTARLVLVGLASDDRFAVPPTQELLADTLGLTSRRAYSASPTVGVSS